VPILPPHPKVIKILLPRNIIITCIPVKLLPSPGSREGCHKHRWAIN
jgi:hypothetical protein